jgi:hypothetical protein
MTAVLSSELNAIAVEALDDLWLPIFVREHPFLDRMAKKKAGGSGYRIPVNTGPGGGAAGNFGSSLNNSAANGFTGAGFQVTPAIVYGTTRIQWQDQAYSETPQSPVDIGTNAAKNSLEIATENLASMLLGSVSGAAGAMAVISTATNTSGNIWDLLLTVSTDAAKFVIGNVIKSKATASAALDTGTGTVVGVNPIGGVITVDVGSTSMTPTATHIIGLEGQLPATTDTSGLYASVLQWVPPAANRTLGVPGGTFLGVTRTASSNVPAVSGWAFDGSSTPIFQAVYATAAYMKNASKLARPDTLYVNPLVAPKMAQACDQKIRYDMKSVSGVDVEYAGFTITLPTGKCDVVLEPGMPTTEMLLSKSGSWEFAPPGGGEIFRPGTNGKMIIDDFGDSSGLNQSRCTTMATGYFGCNELMSNAIITVGLGTGLNL